MTPTSVGMRCPECAREKTKVRNLRAPSTTRSMTEILIGVNVLAYVAELATGSSGTGATAGTVFVHGALAGPFLTAGHHEYWRLVTSGFLHVSLIHIGLNMLMLWFIGRILEPGIGQRNFLVVYLTSLIVGSFGALVFEPDSLTAGASGAIFGVLGALIVVAQARRIPIWQSGLGPTLLINVVFTISVRGISIGAHLGGLVGGMLSGWLIVEVAERRRQPALAIAGCAVIAVVAVVGAIAVAGQPGLTPNGLSLY